MKIIAALLFFSSSVLSIHLNDDEILHKINLTIDQTKKDLKEFLRPDEIALLKLDNYVSDIYESFRAMRKNPSNGILKSAYKNKLNNSYKLSRNRSEKISNTDVVPILETLQKAFEKQFSPEITAIYDDINNFLERLPSSKGSIFIVYDQTLAFYEIQANKLADHLKLAGCEPTLISDNKFGNISTFLEKIFKLDYVIIIGTQILYPHDEYKQALIYVKNRAERSPTSIIPIIFDESKMDFPNIIDMSDSTLYQTNFLELLSELDPKEYYKKTVFSSLLALQEVKILIEAHLPRYRNGLYKNEDLKNFICKEILGKSYENILKMYELFRHQDLTNTAEIEALLVEALGEIGVDANKFSDLEANESKRKQIFHWLQSLRAAFSHKKHDLVYRRNIEILNFEKEIKEQLQIPQFSSNNNIFMIYSGEYYLNVARVDELIKHLKIAGFNVNTDEYADSANYVIFIGTPDLASNKKHDLDKIYNYKRKIGENKVFSILFCGDESSLPAALLSGEILYGQEINAYTYKEKVFLKVWAIFQCLTNGQK